MNVDLRWLLTRLNSNYWFYPALFSILGGALAFTLVYVDRNGFAEFLNKVEWLVPARPDGASNMLTVMAGSMIGVASTVFSITIAAVAYASGTYGPRLLTNFMEDKGNQLSLATFIGTFVYAITVLRAVRGEDEAAASVEDAVSTTLPGFVPQLSLLVAYLLMTLSIAVLVYFLNHVPSSIRINTVLKDIGKRLLEDIRDNYPQEDKGGELPPAPDGTPLPTERTGYIQIIDFEELRNLAIQHGCIIGLEVRTGDFVHPGMALVRICDAEADEDFAAEASKAFTIGSTRTPTQDPQFLIDELVEIGLRALSPGINDPFTAITAMHWLGAATAELGRRDLRRRYEDHPDDKRVHPMPDTFAHFLNRGFGTMRGAIATSPTASLIMFDALRTAAAPIEDEGRVAMLRAEGERLLDQARHELAGPDLGEVEDRYLMFLKAFR
ncbi:DUF2254 domain-containing protein [Qipengyuania marisflavi]|uniref:DUF2254 domain-containing protein n=1 Tax=Qipengyuania marisflavi TaxID=2486356 RepID=A0A5S3P351_9SPHN|nr:DUF2254 domain-containing protein [Qipengyuania marisflavi]TMM47359.1 DUF2254 domain-containing protein [Qipengyuania marisflavi]